MQTAAETGKLILGVASDETNKAAVQQQIEDWQKTAARYRSEPETGEGTEQLAARSKHADANVDHATAKYHHFEIASAAFQISIVLASATIITGIAALAWVSGILTLAGIAITALGLDALLRCICIEAGKTPSPPTARVADCGEGNFVIDVGLLAGPFVENAWSRIPASLMMLADEGIE